MTHSKLKDEIEKIIEDEFCMVEGVDYYLKKGKKGKTTVYFKDLAKAIASRLTLDKVMVAQTIAKYPTYGEFGLAQALSDHAGEIIKLK